MTEKIYYSCRGKNVISHFLPLIKMFTRNEFCFRPFYVVISIVKCIQISLTLFLSLLALNWKAKVRNYCKAEKTTKKKSRKETFISLNVIFFLMKSFWELIMQIKPNSRQFIRWVSFESKNLKDENQFHFRKVFLNILLQAFWQTWLFLGFIDQKGYRPHEALSRFFSQ